MKYIIIAIITLMSFISCVENKDIGIWFREVSHPTTGEPIILELDMRYGYAVSDGETIYSVTYSDVNEIEILVNSGESY